MRGLNKVTLIGHLGKDPEVQEVSKTEAMGVTVAKLSLATSESYRDEEGELHTHTEWHQVVVWGKLAETVGKFLHKGSMIYMEGKLKTRSYEDKEGSKRYVTEVIMDSFIMLDKASPTSDKTEIPATQVGGLRV
jgi:single-strand DNA-binding protein